MFFQTQEPSFSQKVTICPAVCKQATCYFDTVEDVPLKIED
jgi:hypothetical protein